MANGNSNYTGSNDDSLRYPTNPSANNSSDNRYSINIDHDNSIAS